MGSLLQLQMLQYSVVFMYMPSEGIGMVEHLQYSVHLKGMAGKKVFQNFQWNNVLGSFCVCKLSAEFMIYLVIALWSISSQVSFRAGNSTFRIWSSNANSLLNLNPKQPEIFYLGQKSPKNTYISLQLTSLKMRLLFANWTIVSNLGHNHPTWQNP